MGFFSLGVFFPLFLRVRGHGFRVGNFQKGPGFGRPPLSLPCLIASELERGTFRIFLEVSGIKGGLLFYFCRREDDTR